MSYKHEEICKMARWGGSSTVTINIMAEVWRLLHLRTHWARVYRNAAGPTDKARYADKVEKINDQLTKLLSL